EVEIERLLDFYRDFYLKRIEAGLPVDRKGCIYTYAYLQDKDKIKENLLQNPFEKFERKRFVCYSKELGKISLNSKITDELTNKEIKNTISVLKNQLKEYYENLGGLVKENLDDNVKVAEKTPLYK
ncbi:MAG: hypothetical protein WC162_11970, partial [Sphaerochaetaceae bacterium]